MGYNGAHIEKSPMNSSLFLLRNNMAKKNRKTLGIVIGIIGVLMIILGLGPTIQKLVTLVIDTRPPKFSLTGSYPSSDDQAAPSIISQIGSATDFWVLVRDDTSGVDIVYMRCQSTDGSYDSGAVTLSKDAETFPLGGYDWEVWRWKAPALSADKIYKFVWEASDKVGKTASIITWGCYGDADGYFLINGQKVESTDATIYLDSRTIDVKFIGTKNSAAIVSISVRVLNKDSTTTLKSAKLDKKDSTTWETLGFYTFSSDGYYVLEGYLDMPTKSLLKMSIMQQIGEPSELTPFIVVMILGGLVALYFASRLTGKTR